MRIWYGPGCAEGATWRGSVEHTATGARRYFAEYATLTTFIATETKPEYVRPRAKVGVSKWRSAALW